MKERMEQEKKMKIMIQKSLKLITYTNSEIHEVQRTPNRNMNDSKKIRNEGINGYEI